MAKKTSTQSSEEDVAPSLRALHAVFDIPPDSYGPRHGWHTRRDVLQIIAKHADPDGTNSYPGLGTITRYARTEERQTRRAIEWLKDEKKWLIVGRNKSPRRTNLYTIVLDKLPKAANVQSDSIVSDQEPPDRTVKGARSDSAGCLIGQ